MLAGPGAPGGRAPGPSPALGATPGLSLSTFIFVGVLLVSSGFGSWGTRAPGGDRMRGPSWWGCRSPVAWHARAGRAGRRRERESPGPGLTGPTRARGRRGAAPRASPRVGDTFRAFQNGRGKFHRPGRRARDFSCHARQSSCLYVPAPLPIGMIGDPAVLRCSEAKAALPGLPLFSSRGL